MSISHQELQEFPPVMHLLRSFCSDGSKGHFLNFYYGFSLKCFLGLCLLNSKFVQIFTLLKKKIKATKIYHSSHETLPLLEPRIHQRHHYDMPHLSRRTANMHDLKPQQIQVQWSHSSTSQNLKYQESQLCQMEVTKKPICPTGWKTDKSKDLVHQWSYALKINLG